MKSCQTRKINQFNLEIELKEDPRFKTVIE